MRFCHLPAAFPVQSDRLTMTAWKIKLQKMLFMEGKRNRFFQAHMICLQFGILKLEICLLVELEKK
jgi:hypothetical protein